MNGDLASLAAIAAHGSRWLKSTDQQPPPELLDTNSSFQYVRRIDAHLGRSGMLGRRKVAHGTADWLSWMRSDGADQLRLITESSIAGDLPPQVASAFTNGGGWGLLATGEHAALWTCHWSVGDRDAPESRIWDLTAVSIAADGMKAPEYDVPTTREGLATALQEIAQFAVRAEFDDWVPWFAKVKALLSETNPTPPYHADILPENAPLERRQLAAATVQGWVFGGMGSWNDGMPVNEDAQQEYERVSRNLYDALLRSLAAAVNH